MRCKYCRKNVSSIAHFAKVHGKMLRAKARRSRGRGKRSRRSRGGGGGSRHTMGTGGHRYMTYYFHD